MDTTGRSRPHADDAGQSRPDADWLPLPRAARALGISERSMRRRVAAGDLPSRRIGRTTLVAVTDRDREDARIVRERPDVTNDEAGDGRESPARGETPPGSAGNGPKSPDLAAGVLDRLDALAEALRANVERDRLLALALERIGNLEHELAKLREREALPPPPPSPAVAEPPPKPPWWRFWRRR